MEELKVLIDLIRDLPQTALWILIGFFVYKVVIVGSIFGVSKLGIEKLYQAVKVVATRKEIKEVEIRACIDTFTISMYKDALIRQIKRLRGIKSSGGEYIHMSDIEWLSDAIDEELSKRTTKQKTEPGK